MKEKSAPVLDERYLEMLEALDAAAAQDQAEVPTQPPEDEKDPDGGTPGHISKSRT